MGYEILNEDLGKEKKNRHEFSLEHSSKHEKKSIIKKIATPFLIHLLLIIIIIVLLFFYMSEKNMSKEKDNPLNEVIMIIGDIKSFNESYMGNISIKQNDFLLETKDSIFEVKGLDFKVLDFNGSIFIDDKKQLVLHGSAGHLEYGRNSIKMNGENFTYTALSKISMNLDFEEIFLQIIKGRVKLGEELNHDFSDSSIRLNNFNSTLTYDGTFLFMGNAQAFNYSSKSPQITILYKKK